MKAWPASRAAEVVSTGNSNMADHSRVMSAAHRPIVQTKETRMICAAELPMQGGSRISLEMLEVPRPLTRRPRVREPKINMRVHGMGIGITVLSYDV